MSEHIRGGGPETQMQDIYKAVYSDDNTANIVCNANAPAKRLLQPLQAALQAPDRLLPLKRPPVRSEDQPSGMPL